MEIACSGANVKKQAAPSDVLLALLDTETPGETEKPANVEPPAAARPPDDFCYVLSLLLARRRILRLEDTEQSDDGREVSVLFCPRNEKTYRIVTEVPGAERAREIQQQLSQLLAPSNA